MQTRVINLVLSSLPTAVTFFRACVVDASGFENEAVATPADPPDAAAGGGAEVVPLFCFSMMTAGRPVIFVAATFLYQI